jgi:membrane protein implicated in regulation of membrane protease activity
VALAWLVLGILLIAVELTHFAFFALFAAVGAFAAALVAWVLPSAVPLQVLVAIVVAGLGIWLVRPLVSSAFHQRRHDGHTSPGVHGGLVGQEVLTLDDVGDTVRPGHVRLAGERWLAVSGGDDRIPAGTKVIVTAVAGTTLVVWPVDGVLPHAEGELS